MTQDRKKIQTGFLRVCPCSVDHQGPGKPSAKAALCLPVKKARVRTPDTTTTMNKAGAHAQINRFYNQICKRKSKKALPAGSPVSTRRSTLVGAPSAIAIKPFLAESPMSPVFGGGGITEAQRLAHVKEQQLQQAARAAMMPPPPSLRDPFGFDTAQQACPPNNSRVMRSPMVRARAPRYHRAASALCCPGDADTLTLRRLSWRAELAKGPRSQERRAACRVHRDAVTAARNRRQEARQSQAQ